MTDTQRIKVFTVERLLQVYFARAARDADENYKAELFKGEAEARRILQGSVYLNVPVTVAPSIAESRYEPFQACAAVLRMAAEQLELTAKSLETVGKGAGSLGWLLEPDEDEA